MSQRAQTLMVVVLVGIALIANVLATYTLLTEPFPGHNDFLIRWEGARAYWQEGENPYSAEVSERVSIMMYGRPAEAGDYPNHFLYPMYLVAELWPLVNMSYSWASAIWMVVLEVCLVGALVLMLDIVKWRPRPLTFLGLIVWTLAFYFGWRGLILGQVSHLVHFLHLVTLWALFKGHDRLSGAALALATVKPTMGFLLPVFLILWALHERRWRLIGGFVVMMGLLVAISFLMQPSWVGDMLNQMFTYTSYTDVGSPVETLVVRYLGLSRTIATVISGLLVLWLLYTWYVVIIQRKTERFLWTVTLTLVISNLAALRTGTPHYIAFSLVMLIVYLRMLMDSGIRWRGVWASVLVVASLVLPWIHFLVTIGGNIEDPSVYVPLPMIALVALWFTRYLWWRMDSPFVEVQSEAQSALQPEMT